MSWFVRPDAKLAIGRDLSITPQFWLASQQHKQRVRKVMRCVTALGEQTERIAVGWRSTRMSASSELDRQQRVDSDDRTSCEDTTTPRAQASDKPQRWPLLEEGRPPSFRPLHDDEE